MKTINASALNDIDLQERKGMLNPSQTKVINYEFGMSCEENQKHVWDVSKNYLSLAKTWNFEKSLPLNLAKAIGASFTWITHLQARLSPEYEPIVNNLVQKGILDINLIWIEGLPRIQFKIEKMGSMRIIDPGPLQFKKRMISSFKGNILFVGGQHSPKFPEIDYYTLDCDPVQNPDVLGNANNSSHIQQFPGNRFTNIIFDHIGHVLLLDTDLMKEYARVLKARGNILFKTEHAHEEYTESVLQKNKNTMILNMENAGFKNIEITKNKDTDNKEYAEHPWFILINASI